MSAPDFTTQIIVAQNPKQVFDAINNVRGWWSEEIEGRTDEPDAEFKYHYKDAHRSKFKIIEFVPNKKVVWLMEENYFEFTKDKTELTGTKITFDISEKKEGTGIQFTHRGLLPQCECFEICSDAWTGYIQESLHRLISTGKGNPNGKDTPQTENEIKVSADESL